jgi:hypothetical protein
MDNFRNDGAGIPIAPCRIGMMGEIAIIRAVKHLFPHNLLGRGVQQANDFYLARSGH